MPRIRTVKPEVFTHAGLFEEEQETGLPLRLAWIGLWTCCDREGRFRWEPRTLKLDILPFDEKIDFNRILLSLEKLGCIASYVVDGRKYGVCTGWHVHQWVNTREAKSVLPPPPAEISMRERYGTDVKGIGGEVEPVRVRREPVNKVHTHMHAPAMHLQFTGNALDGKGKGKGKIDITDRPVHVEGVSSQGSDAPPPPKPKKPNPLREQAKEAFDLYNAMAHRSGLAAAQVMNDTRVASITARLIECGGIEGWKIALDKVEYSKFCHGANDRGWKADLDFILQPSSFVKIMEGKYDDRRPQAVPTPPRGPSARGQVADVINRLKSAGQPVGLGMEGLEGYKPSGDDAG